MNTSVLFIVLSALVCSSFAEIKEWDCSQDGEETLPEVGFFCVFYGYSTCSASNSGLSEFETADSKISRNPATKGMNLVHFMCNTDENKAYCRARGITRCPRMSSVCNNVWDEPSRISEADDMIQYCTEEYNKCQAKSAKKVAAVPAKAAVPAVPAKPAVPAVPAVPAKPAVPAVPAVPAKKP